MNRTQKLITRAQAAERAGVHVATIDRARKAGKLTSYRELGSREIKVDQDQLDELRLQVVPAQPEVAGS